VKGQAVFSGIKKVINSKLPDLLNNFNDLPDQRARREYSMLDICGGALVMSMLKTGSRNSYNNLTRSEIFNENFKNEFNLSLPHGDTIDDVFQVLPPAALEQTKNNTVSRLIENKQFRKYRLFKSHYLIAIDATGVVSFSHQHCPHCLSKTSKTGITTYFHYVLEAKLVTSTGLAISIASEFIENHKERNFDKQDCELKAFVRLTEKIKKTYPRLPICIIADGIYPNQTVFDICEKYNWQFIISLKDKMLKTVQLEVDFLKLKAPKKECLVPDKNWKITREYTYINDIEYNNKKYTWLQCDENRVHLKNKKQEKIHFTYLTNISLDSTTVVEAGLCARLRWKIENQGFNCQKNSGYELEHKYSRKNYNALQNYYFILQIAHIINQLVETGKQVKTLLNEHSKTTLKDLWTTLKSYLTFCIDKPLIVKLE